MLKIVLRFLIVQVVKNSTVWHYCNRLNYLVLGAAKDGRKKETWKHFSGQPSGLPRRGNSDTITEHSRTPTTSRIQLHSPTCSNLVPCRNSQPVQSGKIEIYILRHWGKLTRDPLILEIVQCLFKRRDKVGGSRDSGNVGEGCHNNNTKNKENQFLSPLFLVGKKDGDPSFYQSQRVEQIDSLCSIENGRTFSVERIADAWIFNV